MTKNKEHFYETKTTWTGNKGVGTKHYRAYERSYTISSGQKLPISGSSDPAFLGDKTKYNPEELFLSSLSSCHLLWYLHLCSEAGIVVIAYEDQAKGVMNETADGSGHFTAVTLYPKVTISDASQVDLAAELHNAANRKCFIANSCNFPIHHKATIIVEEDISK